MDCDGCGRRKQIRGNEVIGPGRIGPVQHEENAVERGVAVKVNRLTMLWHPGNLSVDMHVCRRHAAYSRPVTLPPPLPEAAAMLRPSVGVLLAALIFASGVVVPATAPGQVRCCSVNDNVCCLAWDGWNVHSEASSVGVAALQQCLRH